MTKELNITMRNMLILITFKLTTLKKKQTLKGCYFEKHNTVTLINRRESTLLGELAFKMIMHTAENDI